MTTEAKRSDLASHVHPNPRLPVPPSHSFGRGGDGIVMSTLQRQEPLQPLRSATRLEHVLKEHIQALCLPSPETWPGIAVGMIAHTTVLGKCQKLSSRDCCGPGFDSTSQPSLEGV